MVCERSTGRLGLVLLLAAGAVSPTSAPAQGRGIAGDEHFSINAPDQPRAQMLLAEAQRLRRRLALQWLGGPLDQGQGKTVIHWELSAHRDEGTTWPALSPTRRRHLVWLNSSDARVRTTLAHEMVHVVLFTRFGDTLPVWVHEGVAATEDDPGTRGKRERIAAGWVRNGRLPRLAEVLARQRIDPEDQQAYTAAALLTEFLLAHGEPSRLFDFAQLGTQRGWSEAARQFGWPDLSALERQWHRWLRQRAGGAVALRPRPEVRLR